MCQNYEYQFKFFFKLQKNNQARAFETRCLGIFDYNKLTHIYTAR